ncbi:MAG: hypothetical protein AAGA75_24210 [Cyanobacteria bacterium P01_E01_bin.6]
MPSSREVYQTKRRLFQMESFAVVAVNTTLAIAASVGIVRLIVYNVAQQAKIDLLEAEVESSETRVDQVREEFSQYFDPHQANSIMRQQSHRIEAGQVRIILEGQDSSSDSDAVIEDSNSVEAENDTGAADSTQGDSVNTGELLFGE